MIVNPNQIVKLSCIACIIACIGDFGVMFFLGAKYPGYSQLKDTMSSLGASISPVSNQISGWWILAGLLFIFFGIGFKQAFKYKGRNAIISSWLIIIYGIGEEIGSGAFKADHIGNSLTTIAMIHDALGGIGVFAISILPLFMKKIIPKGEMPAFYRMSTIVFLISISTLLLFSFRISDDKGNLLNIYQGLWQRLMMLNNYIYLITIAFIMLKKEPITRSHANEIL